MKLLNRLILIVSTSGVISCQQLPTPNENSPYFTPPDGSTLTLNKKLSIPPCHAGVYLQYGKVVEKSLINVRYANCKFEVKDVKETPQTVIPDIFEIYKTGLDTEIVLYKNALVASIFSFSGSASPIAEVYLTTWYLRSTNQTNVLYLSCEHWEDPANGVYLTVTQIRQVLGDIMTLQIKEK